MLPSAMALAALLTVQLGPADSLRQAMLARIAAEPGAAVAVLLRDPEQGFFVAIEPDRRFHAASTMKLPVLIELARRHDARELRWTDSLPVHNSFRSLADGSPFSLAPERDGDSTVYGFLGRRAAAGWLAERMIVRSSNLATNLLIERLGAERVTRTIRALGADSMAVLRGVEDGRAFERGLNNTATARDLATLLLALAEGAAASPAATAEMLRILAAQEFNDGIPAGLPPGTRVAHKTGEITGTWHDAALVYPPAGRPFALVVLSRGIPDRARGVALQADLARLAWTAVLARRSRRPRYRRTSARKRAIRSRVTGPARPAPIARPS